MTNRSQNKGSTRSPELLLIAYASASSVLQIVPASANREWMSGGAAFANRCLPLRIANQTGWFILNDRRIEVMWDGGNETSSLTITHFKNSPHESVSRLVTFARSEFGGGILTWSIPFLFRTPSGYNLYVRGPTNSWKDGVFPLDGVVETDWASATFTMNWKITRPQTQIVFERDEPICMFFPVLRGFLERFDPQIQDLNENPGLQETFAVWVNSRESFNMSLAKGRENFSPNGAKWQKHYFLGNSINSEHFSEHEIKLEVRAFTDKRNRRDTVE